VNMKQRAQAPRWFTSEREYVCTDFMSANLGAENAIIALTSDFYPRIVKLPDFKDRKRAPHINGAIAGRLGSNLVVYKSSIGAPAAAVLMETLIASGVKRLLMLGIAGSISTECRMGDVVLPTWGIREEGTSYHYLPGNVKVRPSKHLVAAIRQHLGPGRCKEGGVWSIDAPYRETKGKIKEYASRGVVAVDMESTALMAVAMHRRVDFAPILVISDEAFGEDWMPGFGNRKVAEASAFVCRSALRCVTHC